MLQRIDRPRQYRAAPVSLSGGTSWTVVGPRGLPVTEIDEYLHWLRAIDRSPNTVRAYAFHLANLFEWLHARGLAWEAVTFSQLADFMVTLRLAVPPLARPNGAQRSEATLGATAAVVKEFYDYQRIDRGAGPGGLELTVSRLRSSKSDYGLLAHADDSKRVSRNRLAPPPRDSRNTVQIIGFEDDFSRLLDAARTSRDRLALSAMYDLGLRVGQALGLRHGDLDVMRRRVRIVRRTDNLNDAISKARSTFDVIAPQRFFDLYRDYYLGELVPRGIESDYLFVNLTQGEVGRPMSKRNMYGLCVAISRRAGVPGCHPHMLRHTHATALAAAGWTGAEIAARLGHKHASSTDIYIHLASSHLEKRLAEVDHLLRPPIDRAPGT